MDQQKNYIDSAERLTKLRRFAQLAPQDPEVHLALARELMGGRFEEEAVTELNTVIALFPNHLEARKLLERATGGARPQPR